jgi:hypothetical protein
MNMLKIKGALKIGFIAGLITLIASPVFARSISFKEGGTALWIFLIIGVVIVLLQLIPAMILFFSFIGTTTAMVFKNGKGVKEEVLLQEPEPVKVKK